MRTSSSTKAEAPNRPVVDSAHLQPLSGSPPLTTSPSLAHGPPITFALVIPFLNADADLPRCLDALRSSTRKPDLVVLVDDASTDDSLAVAKTTGHQVLRIDDGPKGPAAARNLGVEAVAPDFEVVAFIDSDVAVAPETFERLLEPLEADPGVVASFGSYDDEPADRGLCSIYANLRHHHVHQTGPEQASTFWAGCGMVRRQAFEAAGGFDSVYGQPSIEDIELGIRLRERGGQIRLVPEAQAKHLKRWTLASLWRTDVTKRAVPWSRLLLGRSRASFQLNADRKEQRSAVSAHLIWLGLLLGITWHLGMLFIVGVAAVNWFVVNQKFLTLLLRKGGAKALLGGAWLHWSYHIYASLTFAAVAVAKRWSNAPPRWLGTSRLLSGFMFGGLLLASLVGLVLWAVDANSLAETMLSFQKDPTDPRFPISRVSGLQHRALIAAFAYGTLAVGMLALGPKPIARVLQEGQRGFRSLRRIPTTHWICLCLFTAIAAWLGARHLGQTMRYDEATSAINYAFNPLIVGLGFYESTNNHMLHSLLMRCAVLVFDRREWAIRLPAFLAGIACVPGLYFAGRTMLGSTSGLIAAAIAAGAVYTTELSTIARGYSLVNLAFVVMIALLPAVIRRRPGAWVGLILVAALGAWAVPMMIYPFAIAVVWLIVHGVLHGTSGGFLRWIRDLGLAVAATGGLVGLFYSPALVVVGFNDQGALRVMDAAQNWSLDNRLHAVGRFTAKAWEQWTYPLPFWLAAISLLMVLVGLVLMLWHRGRSRSFAVACLLGPALVLMATSLAAPPWWALAFAFPIYLLALSLPIARVVEAFGPTVARFFGQSPGLGENRTAFADDDADNQLDAHRRLARRDRWRFVHRPLLGWALMVGVALGNLTSDYPARFPNYMGYRNAPRAAAYLAKQNLDHSKIVTDRLMGTPLAFYLKSQGYPADYLIFADRDPQTVKRIFYLSRPTQAKNKNLAALQDRLALQPIRIHQVGESKIIVYEAHPKATDAKAGPSANRGVRDKNEKIRKFVTF